MLNCTLHVSHPLICSHGLVAVRWGCHSHALEYCPQSAALMMTSGYHFVSYVFCMGKILN